MDDKLEAARERLHQANRNVALAYQALHEAKGEQEQARQHHQAVLDVLAGQDVLPFEP